MPCRLAWSSRSRPILSTGSSPSVPEVRATPEGAHTPVLLMSAVYTDREHSERNAGPGKADGYLLKPFDLAELLLRVRGLIGDGARN